MRVTDIKVSQVPGGQELSARIDGERVWLRFPEDVSIQVRGDPFLAAALLPAMARGETLSVDGLVCPRLLSNLRQLQAIFCCWGNDFGIPFQRVAVEAPTAPAVSGNRGCMAFFSGGVDGWHTLLKNLPDITHLVFAKGIDIQLDNHALNDQVLAVNRDIAREYNKTLVVIETNLRYFGHSTPVGWDPYYVGSGLAAMSLAMAFERALVPGGMTYGDLIAYGTHFFLEHLWSTAGTEIAYDGPDVSRNDKLRVLGQVPLAMKTLRVCWQDDGYNCGRCEKCVRTMIALRLLGLCADGLPPLRSMKLVRSHPVWTENELLLLQDNLELAAGTDDRELYAALLGNYKRYLARRALKDLDFAWTGSTILRVVRSMRSLFQRRPGGWTGLVYPAAFLSRRFSRVSRLP